GLEADRITVVTTDGTMLHRPRKSNGGGADEGEDEDGHAAARTYEVSLEDRVRAMLERVVGPGHADVRVTAEMDPAHVERLEELFDPTRRVLRSEEESPERGGSDAEPPVSGVPGAESTLPTGPARGAPPAASARGAASAAPAASSARAAAPAMVAG